MASKKVLSEEVCQRLDALIGDLEKRTSGEIRLILVSRSAQGGHVPLLLTNLLSSLWLLLAWVYRHDLMIFDLSWVVPLGLVSCVPISLLLAKSNWLERWLLWNRDVLTQVWARAELEFCREGLTQTRSQTGILLFVSLFERQAVVLADKGIASRVDAALWDDVVATMVAGAKTGTWEASFSEALKKCGQCLAEHFPPEPGDTNELCNHVLQKD